MTENSSSLYEGPYATTTRVTRMLTTDDGDGTPVELVRSIDTTQNPELLDVLIEGTLHTVASAGKTYHLAVPVVCHNPETQTFAMVIPSALRWDEARLRKALLDEIITAGVKVPAYVRNFTVLTDPSKFKELEGAPAPEADEEVLEADEVTQLASSAEQLEESKALARRKAEVEAESKRIEEEAKQLEIEKEQLAEVRGRMDRERQQLDRLADELARSEAEFDKMKSEFQSERQQLSVEALNREAQALRAQSGESEVPEESTQVVTDDQFIEIVEVEESELADMESIVQMDVEHVVVAEIDTGVPDKMSDLVSSSIQSAVKLINDRLLALAQVDADRVERLFDGELSFLIQLHEVDGYPIVALLLAQLDDKDQILESVAWPLDPAPDGDRLVLESLRNYAKVRIAFYGPTGKRLKAIEVATPYAENVAWMLDRANELLGKPGRAKYPEAKAKFENGDFSLLGTMRHNFTQASFEDATSPSQLKLAAGIVGYWSKSDTFQYLIGNRCFPLLHFRKIQHRVVTRAAEAGIFINRPLRRVAVEAGVAASEHALVELLVANFAEASISIRENDLEPADQWENWDALLGLGEELGLPPDPDVVELAEVSLKRAQEAEELETRTGSEMRTDTESRTVEEQRPPNVHDSLVIAKRSESTGVTYFLPNDAVLDTFDDLAEMSREDLELLLNDENGRLEAAQMLIERFGTTATSRALEATEDMPDGEVEAMAQFVESKAGGLEAELVRCVESSGENGMFIAARGLAAVKSTSAIPTLIEAMQDDERAGSRERFAGAVAEYGDKLMPALTRAIKRDGSNEALTVLLNALEDREPGTLQTLSKDRSKSLREAARLARKQRESESA